MCVCVLNNINNIMKRLVNFHFFFMHVIDSLSLDIASYTHIYMCLVCMCVSVCTDIIIILYTADSTGGDFVQQLSNNNLLSL